MCSKVSISRSKQREIIQLQREVDQRGKSRPSSMHNPPNDPSTSRIKAPLLYLIVLRPVVKPDSRLLQPNVPWSLVQQHPPPDPDCTLCPCPMLIFSLFWLAVAPMRSLIWRAIVRKACSTLDAFLAEVSRKGIPRLSANSCQICQ